MAERVQDDKRGGFGPEAFSVATVRRAVARIVLAIGVMASLLVVAAGPAPASATPTFNWTAQSRTTSPEGRTEASMAYDAATNQVVLFGGLSATGTLGDTWTWDGTNWTLQNPSHSPPVRSDAAMAYDAATNQVVLFGGLSGPGLVGDTWIWNGSDWSQSVGDHPPARFGASMAYDAATSQVVLFGGKGDADFEDTWTWNGSGWTEQQPGGSPPARSYASMAYDAATDQVVLFGGAGASGYDLGDTWTWNGSGWTLQHPAVPVPSARLGASMAYDAAAGQVVLFGGAGASGYDLGDTWTGDGSSWTQQSPADSPPGRYFASMDFDAAAGQLVLFSGETDSGLADDTWAYVSVIEPQAISFTSAAPTDAAVGGAYTVTATGGGSGNPVVFSADPSAAGICTVTAAGAVTFTAVGKCVIDANQAGNTYYLAAPQAQQTVTVTRGPTTLVAARANRLLFITFSATLTRSLDGAALAGKTIAFSLFGRVVCSAATTNSGVASCRTTGLVIGPVTYTASFAGDTEYLPAAATGKF